METSEHRMSRGREMQPQQTWWSEQEKAFGMSQNVQAPFSRPAVTTGAPEVRGGNKRPAAILAAPRAIQRATSALPIITLSNTGAGGTKVTLPCQVEFPNYVLLKPQQQLQPPQQQPPQQPPQPPTADPDTADSVMIAPSESSGSEACVQEQPSEHVFPNTTQAFLCNAPHPSALMPAGQTVTTAQHIKGVQQSDEERAARAARQEQAATPEAGGWFPFHTTAVTTGQAWKQRQPSLGESSGSSGRRPGLRSSSKRKIGSHGGLAAVPCSSSGEDDVPPFADFSDAAASPSFDAMDSSLAAKRHRRRDSQDSTNTVKSTDDELHALSDKVASLEATQAKLLEHCSAAKSVCRKLQEQLVDARSRWLAARNENQQLQNELEFYRSNAALMSSLDAAKGSWSDGLLLSSKPLTLPTEAQIAADLCDDVLLCQPVFPASAGGW